MRMTRPSLPAALLAAGLALSLTGCDCSGTPAATTCVTRSDCPDDQDCIDARCAPRRDAGGRMDAGSDAGEPMCVPARLCGELCCDEGERCGGGRCCAPEVLCGGVCCAPGRECEVDRCVLSCGEAETACGAGEEAVCCGRGDLCYLGACVSPGEPCERSGDCPEGEYCESTVMRCLPRASGEACEFRPPTGALELVEEWSWSGDAEVLPTHFQVMMAPMVANLTDDNGDGRIDENDIPDVVFHSFTGSDYWGNGVLRAVSGADGSRIWPTSDPGYRTTPGGEIAIADVDPTSPGPEILACSPSARNSPPAVPSAPGHLMILSASGELLRRFDTAPNQVPCGFDAPMVGDMDGDGVPEIVVRLVIAHADGSVVRRIRDIGGTGYPYPALSDLDGDGELDIVTSNGAYRYDGSPVWERSDLPSSGYAAIADLDLDGDPDVTIIGGGHWLYVVDGATGADLWPSARVDINPPELAGRVAANGNPNGGGAPTIANFDDDPFPEIAFAGGFAYVVFGHDGSRQWFRETRDLSSRVTGSSIFDFEGDGIAEVLYNDELDFRVYRGPDGEVMHERCNTTGTLREFPIVVDVDNDGQAEIVLMQNDYASSLLCRDGSPNGRGIRVFGHPRGEWVRTRRIFNQHSYHVTNVNEDGTVPRNEVPNWTVPNLNNFRQNVQPEGLFDAPDATLADLSASIAGCPSTVALSVRVVNRGAAGMPAGVPVTFYRIGEGTRSRVGGGVTSRSLLPGESEVIALAPPFSVPAAETGTTFRFVAVVNDPDDAPLGTFRECRTENNEAETLEVLCPSID